MAVDAEEVLNSVRLEEGKLRYIKGERTEAWIDLILTAQKDEQYVRRKNLGDPEYLLVLPDIHSSDLDDRAGVLRQLWLNDILTNYAPSNVTTNNRVFLDSVGVRIWEDLHRYMPEEKGMVVRKRRVMLLLKEFYGLSNTALQDFVEFDQIDNANINDKHLYNSYALVTNDPCEELADHGLVQQDMSDGRDGCYRMTPKGFRYAMALKRCGFTANDFQGRSSGGALSLFKGGLVPSFTRNKLVRVEPDLPNPTDIDRDRDGLMLTMRKLVWCWKHRNDPVDMSDIDLQLSEDIVEQQRRLRDLDNKIYEPDELEPITTWTVDDQRKMNDDYWNSGQVFWLNPAAFQVAPNELPNYAADPTPPPEWWTPHKPKVQKADTYMRDILAESMKPANGATRYNADNNVTEIYDAKADRWEVVHQPTNNQFFGNNTSFNMVWMQNAKQTPLVAALNALPELDEKGNKVKTLAEQAKAIEKMSPVEVEEVLAISKIKRVAVSDAQAYALSKKMKFNTVHAAHAAQVYYVEWNHTVVCFRTKNDAIAFYKSTKIMREIEARDEEIKRGLEMQREQIARKAQDLAVGQAFETLERLSKYGEILSIETRPKDRPVGGIKNPKTSIK